MKPFFVMKYSSRDESYNHPDNHGKFMDIDDHSGGYPYATESSLRAKRFSTLEEAQDYQKMFKCLDIYRVTVSLMRVV